MLQVTSRRISLVTGRVERRRSPGVPRCHRGHLCNSGFPEDIFAALEAPAFLTQSFSGRRRDAADFTHLPRRVALWCVAARQQAPAQQELPLRGTHPQEATLTVPLRSLSQVPLILVLCRLGTALIPQGDE